MQLFNVFEEHSLNYAAHLFYYQYEKFVNQWQKVKKAPGSEPSKSAFHKMVHGSFKDLKKHLSEIIKRMEKQLTRNSELIAKEFG